MPARRILAASVVALALSGARLPAQQGGPPLTREELAAHVLNRLTFGPRPGDLDHVLAVGVDQWIEAQLRPEAIPDTAARRGLAPLAIWGKTPEDIRADMTWVQMPSSPMMAVASAPVKQTRVDSLALTAAFAEARRHLNEIPLGRVALAEASETQLLEVMTDFWENHFSVFRGKVPSQASLVLYDRDVIRPHALGKFRDLLGHVAHGPTMLYYLDNYLSVAEPDRVTLDIARYGLPNKATTVSAPGRGVNENYARELLELHTLGADGGYTQLDVSEVARAFTGWTIVRPAVPPDQARDAILLEEKGYAPFDGTTDDFAFQDWRHDAEAKTVLGHPLAAGRGIEDGEEVLDILARSPPTARFIARKLAIRFVSDSPSTELVERAAATFTRTDGDIREVMRTILASPDFRSRAAFRAKVKSPFELVVSMRRAFAAPPDTAQETIALLTQLGQPIFGRQSPDGWPETGTAWLTAGSMFSRLDVGLRLARGELASVPITQWPAWERVRAMPFDAQVDSVVHDLLGGTVSVASRAALVGARPSPTAGATQPGRDDALRELIGLALGSPEFQRR